jgi:hypothetical protein
MLHLPPTDQLSTKYFLLSRGIRPLFSLPEPRCASRPSASRTLGIGTKENARRCGNVIRRRKSAEPGSSNRCSCNDQQNCRKATVGHTKWPPGKFRRAHSFARPDAVPEASESSAGDDADFGSSLIDAVREQETVSFEWVLRSLSLPSRPVCYAFRIKLRAMADVATEIVIARDFRGRVGALIAGEYSDDTRTTLLVGFTDQIFEHHEATLVQIERHLTGSAFALSDLFSKPFSKFKTSVHPRSAGLRTP